MTLKKKPEKFEKQKRHDSILSIIKLSKGNVRTVFVLLTRNLIPVVVKITLHSLSSSISSIVSNSLLSLLYFFIIASIVEVNNEYHIVWSVFLIEIRVVVLVEF